MRILKEQNQEYDYNYLDENGLIKENTKMNDKITVIGKVSYSTINPNEKTDSSVYQKRTTWICR